MIKITLGCIGPVEKAYDDNKIVFNPDERILWPNDRIFHTQPQNKRRQSLIQDEAKEEKETSIVPTSMLRHENTEDSGGQYH